MSIEQLWYELKTKQMITIHPSPEDTVRQERLQLTRYCSSPGHLNCGHIETHLYFFHNEVRCAVHACVHLDSIATLAEALGGVLMSSYFPAYFLIEVQKLIAARPQPAYQRREHIRICADPTLCYCKSDDCTNFVPCLDHPPTQQQNTKDVL